MEVSILLYVVVSIIVAILLTFLTVKSCYKICPSDKLLIVNGAGSGHKKDAADDTGGAKIYQGGGAFIIPGFQTFNYLTLSPMSSSIPLENVLTSNNIQVDVPIQITFAIDTESLPTMRKAVRYFSSFTQAQVEKTVSEVIVGAMRSVISSLTVEELISDRDKFYKMVDETLSGELAKMGLKVINRNIRDIQDHNNYIKSMGRKASEAVVQQANIDVAEQDKLGKIGVAERERDRTIAVAEANATQRIQIAEISRDADVKSSKATSERDVAQSVNEKNRQVGMAQAAADQQIGSITAQREAQIAISKLEADAEEQSMEANIRTAKAKQLSAVAAVDAQTVVTKAQYEQTVAKLTIDELANIEVKKRARVLEAEGESSETTIRAMAEAAATKARYDAEANGIRAIMDAQAESFKKLIEATGGNASDAISLLMIEKFETIATLQVEALKNLKIDNITLIGGPGGDNGNMIGSLVNDFITSLPAAQAIAKSAGITLPGSFGTVEVGKDPKLTQLNE